MVSKNPALQPDFSFCLFTHRFRVFVYSQCLLHNDIMKKLYYPWIICAVCMLVHFCCCGLCTIAFSTYLPYLRDSLGLTNTQTSLIPTLRCASTTLFMLVSGRFYGKISYKTGIQISMISLLLARVMFAFARNISMCYAATVLLGFTYAMGTLIPLSVIINNWFDSKRSTALALTTCGSSISTILVPPILAGIISRSGLSASFITEGVFVAASIIVVALILKNSPDEIGMTAYNTGETEKNRSRKHIEMDHRQSRTEAVMLAIAVLLTGIVGTPFTHNISLLFSDLGYSSTAVAFAISLSGIAIFLGKFAYGAASDRIGAFLVNFFILGAWISGALMDATLGPGNVPLMYLCSIVGGIGVPIGTIGISVWSGDLAHPESYASTMRRTQTIFSAGTLIGGPIPGIIADLTGSYGNAYWMFAAMLAVTLIIVTVLYKRHMIKD